MDIPVDTSSESARQKRPAHELISTIVESSVGSVSNAESEQSQKKVAIDHTSSSNIDIGTKTEMDKSSADTDEEGSDEIIGEESEGDMIDPSAALNDPASILASLIGSDDVPTGKTGKSSGWLKAPCGPRNTRIGQEYQADV